MIDSSCFIDNLPREMIPYKGWHIIREDGTKEKDSMFTESVGPFQIITDPIGHGNWHTLYNLLDKNGNKLLPKGIRIIRYFQDGFYLLEDNNEDELINRGDVKGGFLVNDYVSKMNVMREDGTLLDEEWYDEVVPDIGFFRVRNGYRWYWVKLSGETFQRHRIKRGCVIVCQDGKYAIHHSFGDRLTDYYTSVMWSDEGFWNVNMISRGIETHFLHGEGSEIINYAHEVLMKNEVIALLEKDNIWYAFDSLKKLTACFRWKPYTESMSEQVKLLEEIGFVDPKIDDDVPFNQ